MDKWVVKIPKEASNRPTKRPCVQFNKDDIIADPGKRKPIDSYDPNIRDDVRLAYLLKGPCQPRDHNFQVKEFSGGKTASFRAVYFNDYTWLEYSVSKESAFCLWCYVYKKDRGEQGGGRAFVSDGFDNWRKSVERFIIHVGGSNSSHNEARRMCENFQNQRQSVAYVLSNQNLALQDSYRVRLTITLWCVRYLLGQALPFRGHDESEESDNKGNFLELVGWTEFINQQIGKHLGTHAPGNCKMISPDIQKDMVNSCASLTTNEIIMDIGDSFFALLVDESRDTSVKEQMAVVLRYVNIHGQVMERFIGIEHVSDTSAISLKSAIDNLFSHHKLSISKLRGQGYDGASNMSGAFNGLKSKILEENPSAFFVHCFAHQLQLAVVAVSKNNMDVGDFFNYATMIVNISAASCKRSDELKRIHHENILEMLENGEISSGKGQNQQITLKRPGDTRWGSYHVTIIRLMTMWPSVSKVLKNIEKHGNLGEQRSMARSMREKMDKYAFVFTMHLMKKIMGITNELSQALQRKDQDIVNAMSLVDAVKHMLHSLRENEWDVFLKGVNAFCLTHSIVVPNMDDFYPTRKRLQPGEVRITYLHYYRVQIFCQAIDFVVAEINGRFTVASSELLLCMSCLSPNNSFEAFDHAKLLKLAELYPLDFSATDLVLLDDQLPTYAYDVRKSDEFCKLRDIGSLAKKMVESAKHRVFPLIYRLIRLALTLPVATATVERVFSAMKVVKTDARNKMGNQFMNDCMVCYIEKGIFKALDDEDILQRFQKMRLRRTQLPPIRK